MQTQVESRPILENREGRPLVAFAYEGCNPDLLEKILPLIDILELPPDSFGNGENGKITFVEPGMAQIDHALAAGKRMIIHGIGLSMGSYDGMHEPYLNFLDAFLERVPAVWHSEHLGYTRVHGDYLGTMLHLPRTREVLDMICDRVMAIQDRYQIPFLVENIVRLLPDEDNEFTDAAFINAICERTGCGLLLDAYNLECEIFNNRLDIDEFLAEINLANVREIHVACGYEHKGFLLDVHCLGLKQSTLDLAERIIQGSGGTVDVLTYELLSQAIPRMGHDAIIAEMKRLNEVCNRHEQ
ncbi:MAG: DUF692 family protein [Acidobacteriota bacterium]|nr:DUF692 family protein [Acidobacteriota bacterium]